MDDPALRSHKYFRLIWNIILNHPHRDDLTALHGTVLVRGGSVVSWGINNPGRSSFSDYYATHNCFTIHSELAAIRKVRSKIDLTGCVAYNLRLDKHGRIRMSHPCPGCQRLLLDYGIKRCYFTTDSGSVEVMKPSRGAIFYRNQELSPQ